MAELFNTYLFHIAADHWLGYFVTALVHVFLYLNVVAVGALFFIWLERKVSGRIQDRLGPTRVGGSFGWLQTLADGIKLIAKEDTMPGSADPILFKIAPYISLAASLTAFLALPFASGWVGQNLNHAAFFVLAIMGLEVFGVILAGYASGSKWSLFGGMREAAQVVSYEVPVALCVLIPVMVCGTMNLVTIGDQQAGLFTNWLFFHDPFTMITTFVFFTCGMASVNRAPFDLAEAESELVAGFHTEYSGLRWSIFFMAEYGSMFIVSALAAILFFGGWNGPIPIFAGIGPESDAGLQYLANLAGCINFVGKTVLGVTIMIWVRWTLPRLRIDQVITMCWKYCVPIVAACFLGVLAWQYYNIPFINDIVPAAPVNEHWVGQSSPGTSSSETAAARQQRQPQESVVIPHTPVRSSAFRRLAAEQKPPKGGTTNNDIVPAAPVNVPRCFFLHDGPLPAATASDLPPLRGGGDLCRDQCPKGEVTQLTVRQHLKSWTISKGGTTNQSAITSTGTGGVR